MDNSNPDYVEFNNEPIDSIVTITDSRPAEKSPSCIWCTIKHFLIAYLQLIILILFAVLIMVSCGLSISAFHRVSSHKHVSFSVGRRTNFIRPSSLPQVVTFDTAFHISEANISLSDGHFHCSTTGQYLFLVSALGSSNRLVVLCVYKNTERMACASADHTHYYNTAEESMLSQQVILQLEAGDKVYLRLEDGILKDSNDHYTSFTGILLE